MTSYFHVFKTGVGTLVDLLNLLLILLYLFQRPGKDVNKGFVKDFTGANVTRNNFLGALLCNRTMMDGGGALGGALHAGATTGVSTKCLQSTAEDDVFLYWAG